MFPNLLAPSPVYQSMFRAPALPGHPQAVSIGSTSFLVENLLRERQVTVPAHPQPTYLTARPMGTSPLGLVITSPPSESSSPSQPSPNMRHQPREERTRDPCTPPPAPPTTSTPSTTPYLKFGVSAILSPEISPKNGK